MYLYMIAAASDGCGKRKSSYIAIKVGVTDDLAQRLKQLQTGQQNKLLIHRFWSVQSRKMAFDIESRVHHQFAKFKQRGEWYRHYHIRKLEKYIEHHVDKIGKPLIHPKPAMALGVEDKLDIGLLATFNHYGWI